MKHPTPEYASTRILLEVGVFVTVIVLALSFLLLTQGPTFDTRVGVLGLPANIVVGLASLVLALVGIVWMLRIFRGPRDKPPDWRYRDR